MRNRNKRLQLELAQAETVWEPLAACAIASFSSQGYATLASSQAGPFRDFYQGLLTKGMRPAMACLTLARKIAAITLILWKKGAHFDAEQLKPQA